MRLALGAVFAAWLAAQEQAPAGIVRGKLESLAGTLAGGELRIQPAKGPLLLCAYNDKTYIERERLRIAVSSLRPGSSLEMVTDRHAGRCYARTVHVVAGEPFLDSHPAYRPRIRPPRPSWQSIVPRGNLTYSGIVLRLNGDLLLLRTRSEGRKTFLIRHDTGFVERGRLVEAADLAVNTQVFVRAGRNFEGDLEAYLVAWGEIVPAR